MGIVHAGVNHGERIIRSERTARAEIELRKNDRESIVITELPYQVNKARLIEKIADLAREDRVKGIADVRDESGRQGMRVVVDAAHGAAYRVAPLVFSYVLGE